MALHDSQLEEGEGIPDPACLVSGGARQAVAVGRELDRADPLLVPCTTQTLLSMALMSPQHAVKQ